jgi:hypothetical protein
MSLVAFYKKKKQYHRTSCELEQPNLGEWEDISASMSLAIT